MKPEEEIGRELKASELKPETVVILAKEGRPMATAWVIGVQPGFVHFAMGRSHLLLERTGANGDEITDNTHKRMMIYEYLGKV